MVSMADSSRCSEKVDNSILKSPALGVSKRGTQGNARHSVQFFQKDMMGLNNPMNSSYSLSPKMKESKSKLGKKSSNVSGKSVISNNTNTLLQSASGALKKQTSLRGDKAQMRRSQMIDLKSYNPCLEQVYGFDNLPASFNHD